jgi:hypothetical protein
MSKKTYFAIKVEDIGDDKKEDFLKWEIIKIEAYNYHEAKTELKNTHPFVDYHLVPKHTLSVRDIVKKSKHF